MTYHLNGRCRCRVIHKLKKGETMISPPLFGLEFGISGVKILSGAGDPNVAATDNKSNSIASAAVGSVFHRTDLVDTTHQLYVKTALAIGSGPGTWTPK
jgi:hypothetical protein